MLVHAYLFLYPCFRAAAIEQYEDEGKGTARAKMYPARNFKKQNETRKETISYDLSHVYSLRPRTVHCWFDAD